MRPREHLSDIRRAWLGTWFDVRQLWRDRQDILFDPRGALWGEIPLGNRPWPFAVQAMLLPSTIVAAALAIVFVFVDLPPTPAERIISLLTARIERAAGRLSEYDLLSNGAQRPELEKLSLDELRRREDALTAQLAMERGGQPSLTTIHARRAVINEINLRHYFELAEKLSKARFELAMWKIFRRIQMLLANGLFLVTGISMFLNAALFQWLMMKGNPPFEHPWLADSAYLYFMGAALFWPMFLMNVLNLGFDLASRYFIDEPILMTVAKGLIGTYIVILLYMGVRIILMIRPIALALGPQSGITRRRAFWQVAVRLYSAQFITAFLLEIVLLGIIMGIAFGIDLSDTITNG